MARMAASHPSCPHFGECGGCVSLNLEYSEQVRRKRETLEALFGRPVELAPSPDVVYYRNRMDYSIGPSTAGLFKRGSWKHTVDLFFCQLMSPDAIPILRFVRSEAERRGIPGYDRRRRTGFLRYLVLREGKGTGQRMASLISSEGGGDLEPLGRALRERFRLDSVTWQVRDGVSDLSRGRIRRVWGREWIEEAYDGFRVRLLPNSFLQPNTRAAARLYRDLREIVPEGTALLDLYCGVGPIGIAVADRCSRVKGIDNEPENIEAARRNGPRNEYELADARTADWSGFDTIVVDPPRPGLHPKLLKRLRRDGPARLVYVSCNPARLREELAVLPYRLIHLKGYDFAPHTPHIEALAVLERV